MSEEVENAISLAARKRFELEQKLGSLRAEFGDWRTRSRESGTLEKHHTQIDLVTGRLGSLEKFIRARLDALGSDDARLLAEAREVERVMLELHRIWDFFRSKLVLRSNDWFSPYLVAADELAWACYDAARQKLRDDDPLRHTTRQPPLVFFNGESSPFTRPRNWAYEAEPVSGEEIVTEEFRALLRQLPIPVIGVPWFQVQHLPEALVIAHEVGHDVQFDFDLTGRIGELLLEEMNREPGGVDESRQGAWLAWLTEVFADIYGNLATGPAFVEALVDFLVLGEREVASDRRTEEDWGEYPTDYLRILLNVEALRMQRFGAEGDRLLATWRAYYPDHDMKDFEGDIPAVVRAIMHGTYPTFRGLRLSEVISFEPREHTKAKEESSNILFGYDSAADDIRTLFASARLAYTSSPSGYAAADVQSKILKRVPEIQAKGIRRLGPDSAAPPPAVSLEDDSDVIVGEQLYRTISDYVRSLKPLTASSRTITRRSKSSMRF